MQRFLLVPLVLLATSLPVRADEFKFKDGDRVALVGSTLIEREQKYGYWELALTTRNPDKNIIFRNVGWSGDTVWGTSRVAFDLDNPQKGFERLVNAVLAVKPTVIIVGYGTNESFADEAGLPRFKEGLNKLLDAFAPTHARMILLAPLPLEAHGAMLPDPSRQNRNIQLYTDAIRETAKKRGAYFVALLNLEDRPKSKLTTNGIHLTAAGYCYTAARLLQGLSPDKEVKATRLDGDKLSAGAEKLRQAIIEKNQLCFYRYRPQNQTYLFGFRKQEQGNNAVEVPKFDALIAAKEKEIAKLRVPVKHTYELVPSK